jgi:hypothetical protein
LLNHQDPVDAIGDCAAGSYGRAVGSHNIHSKMSFIAGPDRHDWALHGVPIAFLWLSFLWLSFLWLSFGHAPPEFGSVSWYGR